MEIMRKKDGKQYRNQEREKKMKQKRKQMQFRSFRGRLLVILGAVCLTLLLLVWQNAGIPKGADKSSGELGTVTAQAASGMKVVGYFPSWTPGQTGKIRYDVLTHINYAFAIPKSDSTLMPLENGDTAKKIIKKAHQKKVKVLLSVGGWSYQDQPLEPVFVAATSTKKKYQKLAEQILKMCDQYGFDGIDMDWEHPRADTASQKQYEKFMLYLGKKLHKKGKLLTTAVLSGVSADGVVYYDSRAQTDRVLKMVDWINVMAYDGGDGDRHSTYSFAVNCGKYWKKTRKVPENKIVLGLPFYARPSWASYEDILNADSSAWKSDISNYNGTQVWYNGTATIKKKTAYAKKNLGGVMIWHLAQDTTQKDKSLMSAIKKAK